jgi:hypothetical protein
MAGPLVEAMFCGVKEAGQQYINKKLEEKICYHHCTQQLVDLE